jgi:hypothetical protein
MNNKKEMNNERTIAQVAYLFAVERAPFRRARPYCLLDWQGAHSKLLTWMVAVGRAPFRRAHPYCLLDWQGDHSKVNQARKWDTTLHEK